MSLVLKSRFYNIRGKLLLPIGCVVFGCIVISITWNILPQVRYLTAQLWPEFYGFFGIISLTFFILCYMERWK